ncbi:hypothetical protein ACTXL8_07030 [Glutamicibacter arilaitensis]|uniref:hypothetical protein n=1 Tax=Glutamicibacter arilaitensis TaxID=256701 RepID=UPI003FD4D511
MYSNQTRQAAVAEIPNRYVLVFDRQESGAPGIAAAQRESELPQLLAEQGYSSTEYFPMLGIAVVTSSADQLEDFRQRCAGHKLPASVVPELVYRILPDAPAATDSYADTGQLTWACRP